MSEPSSGDELPVAPNKMKLVSCDGTELSVSAVLLLPFVVFLLLSNGIVVVIVVVVVVVGIGIVVDVFAVV